MTNGRRRFHRTDCRRRDPALATASHGGNSATESTRPPADFKRRQHSTRLHGMLRSGCMADRAAARTGTPGNRPVTCQAVGCGHRTATPAAAVPSVTEAAVAAGLCDRPAADSADVSGASACRVSDVDGGCGAGPAQLAAKAVAAACCTDCADAECCSRPVIVRSSGREWLLPVRNSGKNGGENGEGCANLMQRIPQQRSGRNRLTTTAALTKVHVYSGRQNL